MKLSPYLNFPGNTEEVFNFYKSVFGGEFDNVARFGDNPFPNMPEEVKNMIMHISLPVGDDYLMASDAPSAMGFTVNMGNNSYISIHPDSKEEADRLFKGLSEGGKVEMEIAVQPWGDYYGSFTDKYGVQWMINYHDTSKDK